MPTYSSAASARCESPLINAILWTCTSPPATMMRPSASSRTAMGLDSVARRARLSLGQARRSRVSVLRWPALPAPGTRFHCVISPAGPTSSRLPFCSWASALSAEGPGPTTSIQLALPSRAEDASHSMGSFLAAGSGSLYDRAAQPPMTRTPSPKRKARALLRALFREGKAHILPSRPTPSTAAVTM